MLALCKFCWAAWVRLEALPKYSGPMKILKLLEKPHNKYVAVSFVGALALLEMLACTSFVGQLEGKWQTWLVASLLSSIVLAAGKTSAKNIIGRENLCPLSMCLRQKPILLVGKQIFLGQRHSWRKTYLLTVAQFLSVVKDLRRRLDLFIHFTDSHDWLT